MSNFFKRIKNIFVIEKESGSNKSKCESDNNNLDSSNKNKDEKKNIITEAFNYSPEVTYSKTPFLYYNDSFNQCWNGLKLSLNFKPTQFFNLDYILNIEKNKKLFNNYSLNCSTFVPLSSILFPINLILIGHKESSRAISFQSHIMLGERGKLSIITNNIPKEDENIIINKENINKKNIENKKNGNNNKELENNYMIEYSHEFSRGNVGIKFTNLEPNTVNFMFSLYKNLFFGMEFFRNPNKEEKYHFLKANYGIMLKQTPFNKFGFTFNYNSTIPASIINCSYQINNNFKLYLNTIYNKNNLLIKLGQDKLITSISSYYKNNYVEFNAEINNKAEVKFIGSFSFNKYLDILMNFGYTHKEKNKRKRLRCFGFGLNLKNNSVEDKIEELIKSQKKIYFGNNKYYDDYNNIIKLKKK
jgi:hypothetical protein